MDLGIFQEIFLIRVTPVFKSVSWMSPIVKGHKLATMRIDREDLNKGSYYGIKSDNRTNIMQSR
jgi:hypothetical protein